MKFGKLEMNGFVAFVAVVGVISLIETSIVTLGKCRKIRGLEKIADLCATNNGVMSAAERIAHTDMNVEEIED